MNDGGVFVADIPEYLFMHSRSQGTTARESVGGVHGEQAQAKSINLLLNLQADNRTEDTQVM